MNVFIAFLCLLLQVFEGSAPHSPSDHHGGHPPHAEHNKDIIPSYSGVHNFLYETVCLDNGRPMAFYSKNLAVDTRKTMVRDGQEVSIVSVPLWQFSGESSIDYHKAMQEVAEDHVTLYADYWHGQLKSGKDTRFKIVRSTMQEVEHHPNELAARWITKNPQTYQLIATMESAHGSLSMCCNTIINFLRESLDDYVFYCDQTVCYPTKQRQDQDECFPLVILPKNLKKVHLSTCRKEVPVKIHHTDHRRSTTSITTTTTSHNGKPHSPPPSSSSSSTGTSIYKQQVKFNNGKSIAISAISVNKNLDEELQNHPKIIRNWSTMSFVKETTLNPFDPENERDRYRAMIDAAKNHIKAYADVFTGNPYHTYTVTSDHELVKSANNYDDIVYQLNAHLKSTDRHLDKEMCCNLLIHANWKENPTPTPFCAQPACFKPFHIEYDGNWCPFLERAHKIDTKDFKSCWKEQQKFKKPGIIVNRALR